MKSITSIAFQWLASAVLLAMPFVACADKVTFSESRADKRVCRVFRDPDFGSYRECGIVTRGSSRLVANFLWSGVPDVFDADTEFSISLGEVALSLTLGDDPNWAPGKTSARFIVAHEEEYGNEDDPKFRIVRDQTITVRWSAKGLIVTVVSRINSGMGPVIADYYSSNEPGPFNDTAPLSVGFGSFSADVDLGLSGTVKTRTVGITEEYEGDTLISVMLRGKLLPPGM